jgi:hypothetical protein
MDELRLWIRDLGFPITVAVAAIYALYKLFMMREEDRQALTQSLANHAEAISKLSHESNTALGHNTLATQELSDTIKKKFGSDLFCKAEDRKCPMTAEKIEEMISYLSELRTQGSNAAEALLKRYEELRARELRDKETK